MEVRRTTKVKTVRKPPERLDWRTQTCDACANYEPGEDGQKGRCWDEVRRSCSEEFRKPTYPILPKQRACFRFWDKRGIKAWK